MKKFRLEVNEKQLRMIMKALDVDSRFYLGQFSPIFSSYILGKQQVNWFDLEKIIKEKVFPELETNQYYSIADNFNVPDLAREMVDVYMMIRHTLWKSLPKEKRNDFVVSSQPITDKNKFSKMELITVEEIKD